MILTRLDLDNYFEYKGVISMEACGWFRMVFCQIFGTDFGTTFLGVLDWFFSAISQLIWLLFGAVLWMIFGANFTEFWGPVLRWFRGWFG